MRVRTFGGVGASVLAFAGLGCEQPAPNAPAVVGAVSFETHRALPQCNPARTAEVYFVEDERQFYYCDGRSIDRLEIKGTPGAAGTSWMVALKIAQPSACTQGGVTICVGPDTNKNGVLDASEIKTSTPVCSGERGPQGERGEKGEQGEKGDMGAPGTDGGSCHVRQNDDGSRTLYCDDGTEVTLSPDSGSIGCVDGAVDTCQNVLGERGACGQGQVVCSGGKWPTTCPIEPAAEQCNADGVDEDCDGAPDNGCSCLNGDTRGCGICGDGVQTCEKGSFSGAACSGASSQRLFYRDGDGDGYCDTTQVVSACQAPVGYAAAATCSADCLDSNPYIPGGNASCVSYSLGFTEPVVFERVFETPPPVWFSASSAPGPCPTGFRPSCREVFQAGSGSCYVSDTAFSGGRWSCELTGAPVAFGYVTCALEIKCTPE